MSKLQLDYEEFWKESPAANVILDYKQNNLNINESTFGFDYGGVSFDRKSTWAVFSCVSVSGVGRDVLTISVSMKNGDVEEITHKVERA